MAIELPKARQIAPLVLKKREVPLEQIIAVMGNNPIAKGIDEVGTILSQALQRRAELRRQAEEVAAISKATGVDLSGISNPAVGSSIAKNVADRKSEEDRAAESLAAKREQMAANMSLREQLAAMQSENQRMGREMKEQQFQDKQVNSYSSNLEKTGIPNALATADKVLSLLPEQGGDVPGFGLTGMNPQFMLSRPGKDVRQAVSQLFNVELRNRSGAAVTDPELNRLKAEFGQGKFANDQDLLNGVRQFIERLREVSRNTDAGFDPGIREEYITRGGRDVGASFDSMVGNRKLLPVPVATQGTSGQQQETPEQRKARLLMELRGAR